MNKLIKWRREKRNKLIKGRMKNKWVNKMKNKN